MIKSSSSSPDPCGGAPASNCIKWQGGDITCLGIENGQSVSEVVATIATEVCALRDSLDLSDVDLKCVFDLCISCPDPERTLTNVFQLIINKVCTLDEIVGRLNLATSTSTDPVILMASCFQFTDTDGDLITELPLSSYVKRIATQVCSVLLNVSSLADDVQDLQNTTNDLQIQINAIETEIPDVSSNCLYTGVKAIDDAWLLLDTAFCQLRGAMGLPSDANFAISRQCSDANTAYASSDGWVISPTNLAQAVNNIWIVLCDVRARVTNIEDNCCHSTCEDVKIGFGVQLSDNRLEALLTFSSGAGTTIPGDFSDNGSVVTVTDEHFNKVIVDIEITQGATVEVDLTGLNTNDDYTFSVNSVLRSDSVTCQQCTERIITYQSTCSYCEICATAGEGTVTIVYEDAGDFIADSFNPSTTTTTTTTLD